MIQVDFLLTSFHYLHVVLVAISDISHIEWPSARPIVGVWRHQAHSMVIDRIVHLDNLNAQSTKISFKMPSSLTIIRPELLGMMFNARHCPILSHIFGHTLQEKMIFFFISKRLFIMSWFQNHRWNIDHTNNPSTISKSSLEKESISFVIGTYKDFLFDCPSFSYILINRPAL